MPWAKGATPLNANSLKVYETIEREYSLNGAAPSIREIMAATGLLSTSAVGFHLQRLEEMGWIKRQFNVARSIIPVHYPRIHYVRKSTEG